MKIGKLSALCDMSIDTIRYYIKIGLLLPKMQGNMLDFTQREIDDLEHIKKLKHFGFNLKEIQYIFSLKHLSNWIEPDTMNEYVYLLQKRQEEIKQIIQEKQEAVHLIRDEIDKISSICQETNSKMGVPIMALQYLACPNCQAMLSIEQAKITNKYIYSGELSCICGYQAKIEDGIVITKNQYTGDSDKADLKRQLYRDLSDDFYNYFRTCSDLILNQIGHILPSPKVVLEANINGYFFLYKHFKELSNDCLYIIVDKFPEMLAMYKALIELLNLDLNILFIADASTNYPLKNECVDLLVSFFGENEHLFYHQDAYLIDTEKYYAPGFHVLGAFMAYKQQAQSRANLKEKYPESSFNVHDFEYLQNTFSSIRDKDFTYKLIGDVLKSPDKYSFSCHAEGEILKIYQYILS